VLNAGTSLGRYRVVSALGAGGMGEVYRALDTGLDREVALKLLPEDFAADPERHARFEREAKVLASLNHPHIATLYGLEHLDGHHALAMELVEGEGLDERIERGPVPVEEAIPIALQVAEALEAAHEKGVVHRDLKPANIKVRPDGTVKVLDFGLAKALETEGSARDLLHSPTITSHHTREGVILGTAAYMSPEQAKGIAVDKRADIWAFAVVLYEMLAGRRLFAADTTTETLSEVLKSDIDLSALPADTPAAVGGLLRRCLERDPKNRLRDIGEARIVLGHAHNGVAEPVADAPTRGRSAWLWRTVALMVVAVAGASAAFLAGALWHGAGASTQRRFSPLTFQPQPIFNARFSPDGETIVFSAAVSGNTPEIFSERKDFPEPRSLGLPDSDLLAVSSRGELAILTHPRFVGYHRLFVGTLARVPLGGGAPRELLDGVREADWSPDGSDLAVVRRSGGRDRLEFPAGRVLAETAGYFSDLRFSPDGTRIAYFEHPTLWDDRGVVAAANVKTGKTSTISSGDFQGMEGIAWSPDGSNVLFSASTDTSSLDVFATTLAGKQRLVYASPGDVTILDIDRSGRWLVTQEATRLLVRVHAAGAPAERDVRWHDLTGLSDVTADGNLVLLTDYSGAGLNYACGVQRTDGSPIVPLGPGWGSKISPDGRWALAVVPSTPNQLVMYPTGPGQPRPLERGEIETYQNAEWFPDGKRLLVCGNRHSGPTRCYVQDTAGGAPRPVTPENTTVGFLSRALSPDGKRVLVESGAGRYWVYPLDGGPAREVPNGFKPGDVVIHWNADGSGVFVQNVGRVPARVEDVNLTTGARRVVWEIAPSDLTGVVAMPQVLPPSSPGGFYAYSYRVVRSTLYLSEQLP
jgi:Tol biopolymer transport system component/tRNA A-37 threonylcarbamoyl transferase component Bud32